MRSALVVASLALGACTFRLAAEPVDAANGDGAAPGDGGGDGAPPGSDLAPQKPFLTVTPFQAPPSVDLTAEGTADWAHWGWVAAGDYDHKATGNGQISDFTSVGVNVPTQYTDNKVVYTWSDGLTGNGRHDKTSAGGTSTGLYVLTGGYKLSAPAGPTVRHLRFYAGAMNAEGVLDVSLSDNSAAAVHDTSFTSTNGVPANAEYVIDYAASSPGQQLVITWTIMNAQAGGNITLQSATLQ